MLGGSPPRAAWQRGDAYAYLRTAERRMFAWEWLRRSPRYRAAYRKAKAMAPAEGARLAREFGLVEFLPPGLTAPEARPVWRAEVDRRVLSAVQGRGEALAEDRLDIRRLAPLASLAIDDEDVEHWRIGTPEHGIRLDLYEGTLLGGPTPLRFDLLGLERVRPKLEPLRELIHLAATARIPGVPAERRAARWIDELRTADALAAGATQKTIARALFGRAIPDDRWRGEGESYRLRVQRLARAARRRLADPLSDEWFR